MAKLIDYAEQQLRGYSHAKRGYSLRDLILSMGLRKSEWETIKKQGCLTYITKDEKAKIDEFFK